MFTAKEANELRENVLNASFDWVEFEAFFRNHIQENPKSEYLKIEIKKSQYKNFHEKMTELGYALDLIDNYVSPTHYMCTIRY